MDHFLALTEGFLAFALTMLVLATAVSALAGIIHRLGRARARGLARLIDYMFSADLHPIVSRHVAGWEPDVQRVDFLVDMTMVPGTGPVESSTRKWDDRSLRFASLSGTTHQGLHDRDAGFWNWLKAMPAAESARAWNACSEVVDTLTPEDFTIRFKGSRLARQLHLCVSSEEFDEVTAYLSARFSAFCSAATNHFARVSRLYTVLLAFALAFAVNIDSLHLLDTYLSDPLRSSIASSDSGTAQRSVLPIGWDGVYPNCDDDSHDPRCIESGMQPTGTGLAKWLIGVILTGFMVGLGAPYWIEIVNTLVLARSQASRARAQRPAVDAAAVNLPSSATDLDALAKRSELLKLQRRLEERGYDAPATGSMDSATEAAIEAFLADEGANASEIQQLKGDLPTLHALLDSAAQVGSRKA